jgi:hypothetical protein
MTESKEIEIHKAATRKIDEFMNDIEPLKTLKNSDGSKTYSVGKSFEFNGTHFRSTFSFCGEIDPEKNFVPFFNNQHFSKIFKIFCLLLALNFSGNFFR